MSNKTKRANNNYEFFRRLGINDPLEYFKNLVTVNSKKEVYIKHRNGWRFMGYFIEN